MMRSQSEPRLPAYYHRPNIGDVLYALPVIRHIGRGALFLDPGHENYAPIFEQALSFIRRQPYIADCRLYADEAFDYDLDAFRRHREWRTVTLVDSHFLCVGLEPPPTLEPWLTAIPAERSYPVVLHRTPRYHGEVDYTFLHRIRRGDLYCVGYEAEARPFCRALDATWLPTESMDALATIIASCGVFIGNQSSPLGLAAGLGKPRLIEECPWIPNCTFGHANERRMGMDADKNWRHLLEMGYPANA